MKIEGDYSYYAFISYNHRDEKIAKWVQYRLEHYKLPSVARREIGEDISLRPVFRYVSDLGVGVLRDALKKELEASKYLIVICSPNSAKPNIKGEHWVNDEIRHFVALGRVDRIIPLIVEGVVDGGDLECFPPALKEAGLVGVDIQKEDRQIVIQKVVAKLLGLKPDILIDRYREELRKRRLRLFLGILPLLILGLVGAVFSWDALRPVDAYYANYVDSYGLPEGIFPLETGELPGRNIHYRFEYRGISFGKSIHADSAPWSVLRLFGCRRVLRRVVQAAANGAPVAWNHTEYASRPPIQEFTSYVGGTVREIRYMQSTGPDSAPRLLKRLELKDGNGVVNGLLALRGEDNRSFSFARSYGTSTLAGENSDESSRRSSIAQHEFTRDARGRLSTVRFLDVNGSPVQDGDGVWGYEYLNDSLGRPVECWYLGHEEHKRTANRHGVAGRRYRYGTADMKTGARCMIRAEYVDASGRPVLNTQGWMVCVDDFDEHDNNIRSRYYDAHMNLSLTKDGCAGYEAKYDERGFETEVAYVDVAGNPVQTTLGYVLRKQEFDECGNVTCIRYCDASGKPVFCKKLGLAEQRLAYEHGNLTSVRNYDAEGKLTRGSSDAMLSADMKYDGRGNMISCRFIGEDGKPAPDSEGVVEWRKEFDGELCISCSFWGLDGNPVVCRWGMSSIKYTYYPNGNEKSRRFYGTDGKPCCDLTGEGGRDYEYTPGGALRSLRILGADERPVLSKNGYAGYRVAFDANGNEREKWYLGADGNPLMQSEGYAGYRQTFDSYGHRLSIDYLGIDGKLCAGSDNVARMTSSYDPFGRELERRYYGVDERPMCHKDGEAGWSKRYDARGNETNLTYLAVDGRTPIATKQGFVSIVQYYDGMDRVTRTVNLGADGRPKMLSFGYAEVRQEYDEHGNVTRVSAHDTQGRLIANNKEGTAGYTSKYDATGNPVEQVYFGPDGKPTIRKDGEDAGTAGWRMKYDACGRIVECQWVDDAGNPTKNVNGVFGLRKRYDNVGRVAEESYFDADWRPMTNDHGIAAIAFSYDSRGSETDRRYSDVEGGPARYDGWHVGVRSQFDERGQEILREFYDQDGKLAPDSGTAFCGFRFTYDDVGREIRREAYGVDGTMASLKGGFGVREKTYDDGGHLVSEIDYDAHGRVMSWNANGKYSYSVSTFDTSGHEIARRYYGADRRPCKCKNEGFGWNKTYDIYGRVITTIWVGADGEPKAIDGERVYGARFEYGETGQVKVKWWIGRDGNPVSHRDGEAGTAYEYDERGNETRVQYVDASGNAVAIGGRIGEEKAYDADGHQVLLRFIGQDRKEVNCSGGWSRRERSYNRNGHMTSVRFFNADGGIEKSDDDEDYYYHVDTCDDGGRVIERRFFGRDEKPSLGKNGTAGWRSSYEENGRIDRTVYFGLDGKPCPTRQGYWGMLIAKDANGNRTIREFLGKDGELVAGDTDGEAGCRTKFDAAGHELMREYYGIDRKPLLSSGGWARFEKSYDVRGNVTSAIYFDAEGNVLLWHKKDKYAYHVSEFDPNGKEVSRRYYGTDRRPCRVAGEEYGWNRKYDAFGRVVETAWVGPDGDPTMGDCHVAKARFEYDARGYLKTKSYFDLNGRPTLHRDGNAGCRYEYDDRGNETHREFFGQDGKLKAIEMSGLAGWDASFDANGKECFRRNFGTDRQPVCNDEGWATRSAKYDSNGRLLFRRYLDVEGRTVEADSELGIAIPEYTYDAAGNITSRRFYDRNHQLSLNKEGIAGWDSAYDDANHEIKRMYIGTDGKPLKDPTTGCEGWTAKYTAEGWVAEQTFIGADGQVCTNSNGYAICRKSYNSKGKVLCREFFGPDERPIAGDADGDAKELNKYDENGNLISCAWFGADGRPIIVKGGFASKVMTYDEQNRLTSTRLFGTTANCRKRRLIDLRFLRYEGLTAVA